MRIVVLTSLFLWSSSCVALLVVTPSASNGWTNQGPQIIAWQSNNTDPLEFAIILTNQNRTLLPNDQALSPLIDTDLLTTTVSPPAGGWPTPGTNYQVNLVLSAHYPDTVYAQSEEFTIFPAASTTTSITTSMSPSLSTPSSLQSTSSSLLSPHSSLSTHPPVSSTSSVDQTTSSLKRKLHNVTIALSVVCTILALCIVGLASTWWRRRQASQHFPGMNSSQISPGNVNPSEDAPLSGYTTEATVRDLRLLHGKNSQ